VALAAPSRRLPDAEAATSALERVVLDRLGDRDALVATKEGLLVGLAPAEAAPPGTTSRRGKAKENLGALMRTLTAMRHTSFTEMTDEPVSPRTITSHSDRNRAQPGGSGPGVTADN
jgi:hypothetical protein